MTYRPTSNQAYAAVLHSGLVGKRQAELYDLIFRYQDAQGFSGIVSQAEVRRITGDQTRTYGPRFAELVRRGLIYEAGYKADPETGQVVVGYRTTDVFPTADRGSVKVTAKGLAGKILAELLLAPKLGYPVVCEQIRNLCREVRGE